MYIKRKHLQGSRSAIALQSSNPPGTFPVALQETKQCALGKMNGKLLCRARNMQIILKQLSYGSGTYLFPNVTISETSSTAVCSVPSPPTALSNTQEAYLSSSCTGGVNTCIEGQVSPAPILLCHYNNYMYLHTPVVIVL